LGVRCAWRKAKVSGEPKANKLWKGPTTVETQTCTSSSPHIYTVVRMEFEVVTWAVLMLEYR